MKIRATLTFLFLSFYMAVAQNQYVFRHLDIVDGLSDNQIRSLSITPDGRLGVRTASILNIYNGATFEHFYQDKHKEYEWNYIRSPKEYYDDRGRIWMKERGYLLLLDLNTNQFDYDIQNELNSFGIRQRLDNMFIDAYRNYWFVTEDNTFLLYEAAQQKLSVITSGDDDFVTQYGVPVELTQYKNLCWIVYSNGLIRCWDYASHEFVLQDTRFLDVITSNTDRIYIHPASNGDIWLMINSGIHYYNRTDKVWKEVASISGLSNFFTCMDVDREGNVWAGTSRSGLRVIDNKSFEVETITGLRLEKGGILVNDIHSVLIDDNDGVWVGTLFQGLCYYQPGMIKFSLVQTVYSETLITNETIRCFLEDEDGTILVGAGSGLYRFYPDTKKTEKIFKEHINDLCLSLYRDTDNRIWVGTYLKGFFCIDGKNIRNYVRSLENLESDPNQNVSRAIYEDSEGNFWVSVTGGIGKFDPGTGKVSMLYEKFPQIKFHKLVYNFYPIDDNTFAMIGESGIFYYNTATDKVWIPQVDDPDSPKFQDYNTKYYCIWKDSRSLEWFGTENGIRVWDDTQKKLYRVTVENGLPNNTVSGILEDSDGIIWVSTANGISRIRVQQTDGKYEFSLVNFGTSDGLQSGKFYDRSILKSSNGTLYFGGIHGFNYFNPKRIIYNESKNKPVFTGFSLFNSPVKEGVDYKGRTILKAPVNHTTEIKLKHNENFITLEFAGLNYVNPAHTYYKYKLENFDENWNEILTNGLGRVTYTGLRPGKYKLIVYTANNDKVWGDEPAIMTIEIAPPIWATHLAIAFYILLAAALLYYMVYLLAKRNRKKLAEQKEINERKHKEELDQMKFRFFTNISHEFRTPLSLIITPLETLIKQQKDVVLIGRLELIKQNADSLLNLVNQLLDFRKLEMKGEKIALKKGNIIQLIESVYIQFKEAIANKRISFMLEKRIDRLIMYYDQDKIYKILNNLLSNALKFTPEEGFISINVYTKKDDGRTYLVLDIVDTGCGIAEGDIELIFDRFYQTAHTHSMQIGSGIGLHLVKEYVKLHEGKVIVDSKENQGSTFTVYIPVDLVGPEAAESFSNEEQEEPAPLVKKKDAKEKCLLIVEDNTDFRKFLVEQLSPSFRIIEAENGEAGEKLAVSESPELIVSDLMMPKMDGIEFCQRIKNNIQTSHIPFILLTARSSDEAKTEGYEAGADSYISKPFNFEMLQTRILKLIEQQEKRKELFYKTIEITPSSITITSLDEELVQKVLQFVEDNMDNTEYSVDDLGKDVGLSRSQLYRKLQSITGLSPLEFIRSVRLKRAAQLLIASQYNVSEIADIVGFNTLKYFNKYFKEEFGMTPTQYRQQNKPETDIADD